MKSLSERFFAKRRKKVVVLVDFENLKKNTLDDPEMEKLGRFLEYLTKQEERDVISLQVFSPSHISSAAKDFLFAIYDAELILQKQLKVCPRNHVVKVGRIKDVDTVDEQIKAQGKWLVDHVKDLYQVIVVSNDDDFRRLKIYAKRHGVKFMLFTASEKYSLNATKGFNGKNDVFQQPEQKGGGQ